MTQSNGRGRDTHKLLNTQGVTRVRKVEKLSFVFQIQKKGGQ